MTDIHKSLDEVDHMLSSFEHDLETTNSSDVTNNNWADTVLSHNLGHDAVLNYQKMVSCFPFFEYRDNYLLLWEKMFLLMVKFEYGWIDEWRTFVYTVDHGCVGQLEILEEGHHDLSVHIYTKVVSLICAYGVVNSLSVCFVLLRWF